MRISMLPALAAAVLLAACDVNFIAPKVAVLVQDDSIAFAAGDEEHLTGGETVLTIRNESAQQRQIVLARTGESGPLPRTLREVERPGDDERIVDITQVLAPAATDGEGEPVIASARLHVYLAPGERHALFDRLGESDDAMVLDFVPGDMSAASGAATWQ